MAKGLVIPLTADIRKFLRGMKVSSEAVEDLGDEFRDVERKSDRAADDIERNFEDAAKDSGRAFERLYDDAKDEFDRMERAARDAGDDIDRGLSDGFKGASTAGGVLAGEVFDEFIESWGEAVRSGDYGDAIRETFSNLGQIGGAAFGPVGAAGGAVAGFFLTGIYDKITDSESKEQIARYAGALFDGGDEEAYRNGYELAEAFRQGAVAGFGTDEALVQALNVENEQEAWRQVAAYVESTGLPEDTIVGAILGRPADVAALNAQLATTTAASKAAADEAVRAVEEGDYPRYRTALETQSVLDGQISAMLELRSTAQDTQAANEAAARAAETEQKAADQSSAAKKDAAASAREIKTDLNNTRVPNAALLASDLSSAATSAATINRQVREIPTQKSVTVRYFSVGDAPGRAIV